MPYLADAAVEHSGTCCVMVLPHTHEHPETYMNVRLTNGAVFYASSGNGGGGLSGSEFIADQGSPAILSSAWPIKITDGMVVIGTDNSAIPTREAQLTYRYDLENTGSLYVGSAPRGSTTNEPVWTIKRTLMTQSGNPASIMWAGPTAIWDDREAEGYD